MLESDPFVPFQLATGWHKVLSQELQKPYILSLAAFIENEYASFPNQVFPPKQLLFNAFNKTPFEKTQVVIIGQDPYHGYGQAMGLSFSVPAGVPVPPSLKNIFKEIHQDLHIPVPQHGSLTHWAEQGVLLLNSILTVRKGEPMSHHKKGWETFTDAVVQKLAEREDPVIFVLWGKPAQEKCRFIKELKNHTYLLTAPHPSPYSAATGFFGCKHFSKINQLLEQQGKTTIDRSLP